MLEAVKKHIRIVKTCNLYLSFFTLGMLMSLMGPCLLDLQHLVRTDTRHIALIYTARSIGYLAGAIFGGVLLDIVKSKQAVLTGCNFFATASMFGIPWSRNFETLMGFMVINGFSLGAIETGANVVCLQLWGKKSGPFFQAMHFTFGLGGLVSPLIAAPYLENFKDPLYSSDNATFLEHSFNFSENFTSHDNITEDHIPKLLYPFSIIGTCGLLVTILFVIVFFISPTEEIESQSDQVDSEKDQMDTSSPFMFSAVGVTFLIVFVAIGTEIGFSQTLTAYAVKGRLHTTTILGSYMTSAFWGAFTMSRLVSVFLAFKLKSLVLVIADTCIVAASGMVLLTCMPNEWALWLAAVLFGIGIGPFYAVMVGWVRNYINVTNKISAIVTVGCAAGEMVGPFIITYFIDQIPEMFAFVTAACSVIVGILIAILYFIFKNSNKNNKGKKEKRPKCYVIRVSLKELENMSQKERESINAKEQECYEMTPPSVIF